MGLVDIDRGVLIKNLEDAIEALQHANHALVSFRENRIEEEIRRLRNMKESDIHDPAWIERGIARLQAEREHLGNMQERSANYGISLREDTDRERGFRTSSYNS